MYATLRVVGEVVNIGQVKMKIGVSGSDVALAPANCLGNDVDSLIVAAGQVSREWPRHAPDTAADLEYLVFRLQISEVDEVAEELVAGGLEIPVAHEIEMPRRDQLLSATKQEIHPIESIIPGELQSSAQS